MSSGSSSKKRRAAEAESKAKKDKRRMEAQVAGQRAELERQQSDLAMRTSAGLRARQRGQRASLLGADEETSTLG